MLSYISCVYLSFSLFLMYIILPLVLFVSTLSHTCQPIQFTSIKKLKIIILGGYGHTGKWIQENIIFMRLCCCFKLSKKSEKLLNEQPTHAIAKCTLTGLVQYAKKACWK